jgi:hypothetical protein
MCLSTQALILFLSLLPRDIVEPTPTDILVQAETGPVVWQQQGDTWCTTAPLVSRTRQG